jgi:hypothetical protein
MTEKVRLEVYITPASRQQLVDLANELHPSSTSALVEVLIDEYYKLICTGKPTGKEVVQEGWFMNPRLGERRDIR